VLKVGIIFVTFFYLLPILIVANNASVASILVVLIIIAYFYFGIIVGALSARKVGFHDGVFDSSRIFWPALPLNWVFAVSALYFLTRAPNIAVAFNSLLAGEIQQYMLARAVGRYNSELTDIGFFYQIGTVLFILMAGMVGSRVNIKAGRFVTFSLLVVAILVESLQLARASVLVALLMFFSEYLLQNNYYLTRPGFLKLILPIIGSILGLFVIFFFSQYFRVAQSDYALEIVANKFSTYTVAMYSALMIWLDESDPFSFELGFNTFTFIAKLSGAEIQAGFVSAVSTPYGVTNIYTNIRGLISDFSVIGASFVFFVSGFYFAFYSFRKLTFLGYIFLKISICIVFFPLYSPFYFTVFSAAFVLICMLSWANRVVLRESKRQ